MKGDRKLAITAALSLVAAVALVLGLTRPVQTQRAPARVTEVVREPGDPAAARDEEHHFAPGSPAAVAERFLRARLRYHYDDAAALATGVERARCDRNVELFRALDPDTREGVRREQLVAEAARFDFSRVVVEDLPAGDAGVARKRVRGVVHAVGPVRGGTAESSREQELVMHLVDGAWRVAEWTPRRFQGEPTVR